MLKLWPVDETFSYHLRVDETSTPEEVEAEVEYWMNEISTYGVEGKYRSALLQAIKWMNSLA